MTLEALVQTRVPREVAESVAALAATEGLSVAAWLRRMLIKEATKMRIRAWVVQGAETAVNREIAPSCLLEHVRDISATEAVVHVLNKSGVPETLSEVSRYGWIKEPEKFRFYLEGGPAPWTVVRAWWDSRAAREELVLRLA
ncbi:MAG: hypothetical protein ACOYM9_01820 [Bradymonadia bacterium]